MKQVESNTEIDVLVWFRLTAARWLPMAGKAIEPVSPEIVVAKVLGGIVLIFSGLFFLTSPQTKSGRWLVVAIGVALLVLGWRSVTNPKLVIRYYFNPGAVVLEAVHEWQPQSHKLESEYERDLQTFLQERFTFKKITCQYGAARVKCDLAVGNEVMIELKAGFKSTSKLQRLIGQIDLYKNEWNKPLIVILLGDTAQDLLHDLHDRTQRHEHLEIITKEAKEIAEVGES